MDSYWDMGGPIGSRSQKDSRSSLFSFDFGKKRKSSTSNTPAAKSKRNASKENAKQPKRSSGSKRKEKEEVMKEQNRPSRSERKENEKRVGKQQAGPSSRSLSKSKVEDEEVEEEKVFKQRAGPSSRVSKSKPKAKEDEVEEEEITKQRAGPSSRISKSKAKEDEVEEEEVSKQGTGSSSRVFKSKPKAKEDEVMKQQVGPSSVVSKRKANEEVSRVSKQQCSSIPVPKRTRISSEDTQVIDNVNEKTSNKFQQQKEQMTKPKEKMRVAVVRLCRLSPKSITPPPPPPPPEIMEVAEEENVETVDSDLTEQATITIKNLEAFESESDDDGNNADGGSNPVELIIAEDVQRYRKLRNSDLTNNLVVVEEKLTKVYPSFVSPELAGSQEEYPGVTFTTTDVADEVKVGYIKLEPKTLRPLDSLSNVRLIYWIIWGTVTVRSTGGVYSKTDSANQTPSNYMFGKQLSKGSCITIPPSTCYTIENWEDRPAMLGFCSILTEQ